MERITESGLVSCAGREQVIPDIQIEDDSPQVPKAWPGKHDPVKRPAHYRQFDSLTSLREVEAIDVIESIVGHYDDPVLAGLVWQQLKYLIRAPHKGKLAEDLSKADWYGRRAANKAAALKPKVQRD